MRYAIMTARLKYAGILYCQKHGNTKHVRFPQSLSKQGKPYTDPVCIVCLAVSMQTKTPPIKRIFTK